MGRIYDRVPLWPANTVLNVHIGAWVPMTIDGKKVRFDQLVVGQTIIVQYSILISPLSTRCHARGIQGWTSPPAHHAPDLTER